MSLWVDKYRPGNLSKLDFHTEQAAQLQKIVHSDDFPHLLVYGPPGAGKKTRITCILRELYGHSVDKLRLEHQSFMTPSKKKLEITTVSSNYHIEVNPSEVGIYDRVVIQELIKQMASTQQLDTSQQRDFKVVLLLEADLLTKDAQHALRRTMEKYTRSCRLILCANSISRVIPAVRSRCFPVRVAAPDEKSIANVLRYVCRKEGITLPDELANRVSQQSGRNLRRALLMLEACRVAQYPLQADQAVTDPDWKIFLAETGRMIVAEQSPRRLLDVRGRLYELLGHCIPSDVIMRGLVDELTASCDGTLKTAVVDLAAEYEHRMQLGSKPIFHIEAFVAKFMSIYKTFIDEAMMEDW